MTDNTRPNVLALAELLTFNLEDTLGTVRSLLADSNELSLSERQWLLYLEETLGHWFQRLNSVRMFQATLFDGHR